MNNQLHYGDNLQVMREKIPGEVSGLIYLDPPFHSARNYNLLCRQVTTRFKLVLDNLSPTRVALSAGGGKRQAKDETELEQAWVC